jgi:Na+-driven multidrug efflux pump
MRTGLGHHGVYVAIAIAYSLSAVFGMILFRRGKWKQKEV